MLISHNFYLTDAIAKVAEAKATTIGAAVETARTAIVESSLRPSEKRTFTAELKSTATRRTSELLTPMSYATLRHHLLPVTKWILRGEETSTYAQQFVTALEMHALAVAESPENLGLLDPDGEDDDWELHDDPVAWRVLLEYDPEFVFPHVLLSNEDEGDDGHFDWMRFIAVSRWMLPTLHVEVGTGMSTPAPTETLADIAHMMRTDPSSSYWLKTALVPSSCPELLVYNPLCGGVAETIIPRRNVHVAIHASVMPEVALGATSLRLEGTTVMFTPCDVTGKIAFQGQIPLQRNVNLELHADGTIVFL